MSCVFPVLFVCKSLGGWWRTPEDVWRPPDRVSEEEEEVGGLSFEDPNPPTRPGRGGDRGSFGSCRVPPVNHPTLF